jgi:isoquinoline 1-oxidoreductase beta subunit
MAKKETKGPSRRLLLIGGLAAGGGLAVAAALQPFSRLKDQRALIAKPGETPLLGALRIGTDDTLTVIIPHADMGVGNGTALAQMLAEELDADWSKVRIERAPAELAFANGPLGRAFLRGETEIPGALAGTADFATQKIAEQMRLQITGGSTAVRFTGVDGMRRAGAAARQMLIRAAAKGWSVPESDVTIENGVLRHSASCKTSGFGAFAAPATAFAPSPTAPLKAKSAYAIVGQPKPRFDIPAKVTGAATYSGDLRLEGMVYAAIRACPVPGGALKSCDEAPAKAMRGVVQVVKLDGAVAVLADNTWRARQALAALEPEWEKGAYATLSSASTLQAMSAAVAKDDGFKSAKGRGDARAQLAKAATVVERVYTVPYLAHAAMEPVGCVAQMKDGKLLVWGAFQDALGARYHAAKFAKLNVEDVVLTHTEMGGAFGRRGGTLNFLEQAIGLAQATDRPVNLTYDREEDMRQDYYRNASAARMRASLDGEGYPIAIVHDFAEKHDPPEAFALIYDGVAHYAPRFVEGLNAAPWGPWRSVDHSVHGFFVESFIDELAAEAGADPLAYRKALAKGDARKLAVLDKVAAMSAWDSPRQPGTGKGVALVESFGTIVAEVIEVVVNPDGLVRVLNVWVAADPGEVVNPNGFAQQMESGVIYGLSAALYERISFVDGAVMEGNFPDYPVITMADCPSIRVETIASGAAPGGAGEPGTPPAAPAYANAVFAASGVRMRDLPFDRVPRKIDRPA